MTAADDVNDPFYPLLEAMDRAEAAAWSALARYKFERFGYHAATWVTLNRLLGDPKPSPFRELVAWTRQRTGIKAASA